MVRRRRARRIRLTRHRRRASAHRRRSSCGGRPCCRGPFSRAGGAERRLRRLLGADSVLQLHLAIGLHRRVFAGGEIGAFDLHVLAGAHVEIATRTHGAGDGFILARVLVGLGVVERAACRTFCSRPPSPETSMLEASCFSVSNARHPSSRCHRRRSNASPPAFTCVPSSRVSPGRLDVEVATRGDHARTRSGAAADPRWRVTVGAGDSPPGAPRHVHLAAELRLPRTRSSSTTSSYPSPRAHRDCRLPALVLPPLWITVPSSVVVPDDLLFTLPPALIVPTTAVLDDCARPSSTPCDTRCSSPPSARPRPSTHRRCCHSAHRHRPHQHRSRCSGRRRCAPSP